jgi:hypothetical protein
VIGYPNYKEKQERLQGEILFAFFAGCAILSPKGKNKKKVIRKGET